VVAQHRGQLRNGGELTVIDLVDQVIASDH
jgi:hypothetical protein